MLPSKTPPRRSERRSSVRLPCSPQIVCQVVETLDQAVVAAGPWNISAGGACFLIEARLPRGAHVEVEFQDQLMDARLRVPAEVVHALLVPSHNPMWLTGCSFVCPPLADEELKPYTRGSGGRLPG